MSLKLRTITYSAGLGILFLLPKLFKRCHYLGDVLDPRVEFKKQLKLIRGFRKLIQILLHPVKLPMHLRHFALAERLPCSVTCQVPKVLSGVQPDAQPKESVRQRGFEFGLGPKMLFIEVGLFQSKNSDPEPHCTRVTSLINYQDFC